MQLLACNIPQAVKPGDSAQCNPAVGWGPVHNLSERESARELQMLVLPLGGGGWRGASMPGAVLQDEAAPMMAGLPVYA